MNLIGKSGGSREDKEEKEKSSAVDRWLSSSSTSYHYQQQPQHFLSPPSYHQQGGWLLDRHSPVGEPSSNHEEEQLGKMMVEREHMFDKVVTPSDVGKLNRLVIPKQHAERYFPLDSSTNDKGLLLNFEDRYGKLWRFRYSYWNSSQSYVMTKGWSRFVKEKRLDAGDIVSFQRGVGVTSKDRLFIDWRRRVNAPSPSQPHQLSSSNLSFPFYNHNFIHPWNPLVLQSLPARRNPNLMLQPPNTNPNHRSSRSVYFGPSFGTPQQQVHMMQPIGFESPTTPVNGKSSGKRLRLFGVNMDCAVTEEEDDQDYDHPSEFTRTAVASCSNSPLNPSSSSSSFSTIPYLQLGPYGRGTEYNQSSILSSSSSAHDFNIICKSPASNMSLDLEI